MAGSRDSMTRVRRWMLVGLVNLLILAVLLSGLELLLWQLYLRADAPRGPFGSVFLEYNRDNEFEMAHFLPECAKYDPDLAYTMKPGQCEFSGREFHTTLRINSAGLRDDERSLVRPRIIVLGDSHSMGWGVEAEESWPQILELELGEPVLNTAIPSYGTVRELRGLTRLDLDALELLILQYSDNDYTENASFAAHGDSLWIMSEETYRRNQSFYAHLPKPYRFGKFLYTAQKLATNAPIKAVKNLIVPPIVPTADEEAEAFLHALRRSPVPLDDVQIIAFEFPGWNQEPARRRAFVEAVRSRQGTLDQPGYIQRMIVLDVSGALTVDDYFSWDPHVRVEGQAIIADRVVAGLRSAGFARF